MKCTVAPATALVLSLATHSAAASGHDSIDSGWSALWTMLQDPLRLLVYGVIGFFAVAVAWCSFLGYKEFNDEIRAWLSGVWHKVTSILSVIIAIIMVIAENVGKALNDHHSRTHH